MKLLILGKDGQVGRALQRRLMPLGDVSAHGRADSNLEEPDVLAALIARERPDIVVNAAAYTAVDQAEDDRARAWKVNAEALETIGAGAKKTGALVGHCAVFLLGGGRSLVAASTLAMIVGIRSIIFGAKACIAFIMSGPIISVIDSRA